MVVAFPNIVPERRLSAPPNASRPLPRRAAASRGRILVDWTMALHDAGDLEAALIQVVNASRAEVGVLTRRDNTQGNHRHLVVTDPRGKKRLTPTLKRSCACALLGERARTALSGSIWLRSDHVEGLPASEAWLDEWCRARGIAEIVVVVLDSSRRFSDFLELHFSTPPGPRLLAELQELVDALVYSWSRRRTGCIVERYWAARRTSQSAPAGTGPSILDATNPISLSRCEYRVCLLVGRGMNAKAIADELALTEATVRSHLRSIFSKSGVSSQVELMYHLHGAPQATLGAAIR